MAGTRMVSASCLLIPFAKANLLATRSIFESIENYTKTEYGYATISNVNISEPQKLDSMPRQGYFYKSSAFMLIMSSDLATS